jgi:hypothetical protein
MGCLFRMFQRAIVTWVIGKVLARFNRRRDYR